MPTAYYSTMLNRRTAVYRAYDAESRLLYVGISMSLTARLTKHRSSAWWPLTDEITVQWFDGREAAKAAERAAIRDEGPIFNVTQRSVPTVRIREVDAP